MIALLTVAALFNAKRGPEQTERGHRKRDVIDSVETSRKLLPEVLTPGLNRFSALCHPN